ncbi:MAG TPA: metalloregulator ArsR/SmtB family transcription factor [Steroidobacteraceae bacterium]|jgi:ArsR family transcriptional regulator|nr:metalloregulator ArsR/SmtB family transcription factor [Steroidobacteraceae bacterium]
MSSFNQSIELLRALAEPTRFRLLALLKDGELTVGEIAEVLEQSQPRISRHLKLLTDVYALERFREEQRIYYRLNNKGDAATLVELLLSQLNAQDAVLKHDHDHRALALEKRARVAAASWDDVRRSAETTYNNEQVVSSVIKGVFSNKEEQQLGELLDVGTGSGSMLRVLGGYAKHAIGLDISTQALRVARAKVHGAGLNHCEFKRGDMYELPFDDRSFDAVTFDQVLSVADKPAIALREAVRVLRSGGRVIVIENEQRLDEASDDKPQTVLRRWLERAGVHCERIKAVNAGEARLLLGVGQRM